MYLPQDRLRAIANGVSLPDRTSGSVLFADISGFTALTEYLRESLGARQGAEELTKQLSQVYSALIAVIEKYGGSVLGFAGDSMLCWFNEVHGSSSMRAVACASEMQTAIREFPSLALKVAVASGDARRFVVGDEEIQKIDVLAGAPVARTAIGEHLANQGDVLIDDVTVKSLGDEIEIAEWRVDEESQERFGVFGTWKASDKAESLVVAESEMVTPVVQALQPYIHHAVYQRETSGQESFLTEFRPCVALFIRFTGIDYDSDSTESELDAFIRTVQGAVSRYRGTLMDITIGDKGSYAYVNFGALSTHEDDSRRAVKTALELRNKTDLQLQMGITQGLMRVGAYGGETRKVFGALGDDVNLSARLMTTAKANEILLSSHVYEAVRDDFTFEPRPPLPMKGKANPLPVFAVTGESQRRAVRLQEPNYSLPMVGRQAELKLIEEKLDLAKAGKSQVIGIVAEAGLGKSRLVAEVIRNARRKGFVGFGGACQSDGIHTPYMAWKSIWGAFFDVDPEMPERKLMRNIEGEIEDRAPSRMNAMPLLNVVLDLNIPENDFTQNLEPKIRQSALHALLEDCLKAQASNEPTLIVIEDLHWIDALSHDLLEGSAKALASYAVCFVLAYRPPELLRLQTPRLEALPQFTRIELDELTSAEAESAVRAKLTQLYPARSGALPEGLVEALMRRAQGNPFYLEELLNYVRDRGLDPSDIQNIELPNSLHTLILSRIDQLSEAEKTTLRAASIVGRLFRAKWLTGYYPELGSFPQVKAALDELDKLEITPLESEPELTYLFKHIVTHEVTYESLPFATRAQLHEQLARSLESADAPVETIAFHYLRSENQAKQIEYLRKAGEISQKSFANDAALEYYEKLLLLLKDDTEKAQIHLKRGEIYGFLGKHDEAETDFRRALNSVKDDLTLKIHALNDLAAVAGVQGDNAVAQASFGEVLEIYSAMLKSAEDEEDLIAQARVLQGIGQAQFFQGNHLLALGNAVRAQELARRTDDKVLLGRVLLMEGQGRWRLGDAQSALPLYEQALAIFTELNDKSNMASSMNLLGGINYTSGRFDQAGEYWENALNIFYELGNRAMGMNLSSNLGALAEARGDYEIAFERYNSALNISREIGSHDGQILLLTNRGSVQVALKNYRAAEKDLTQAIALAGENTSLWNMPLTYNYHAEALLGLGKYEDAFSSAHQALVLAKKAQTPEYIGLAWRTLGMICSQINNTLRFSDSDTHQEKDFDAEFCFNKSLQILTDAKIDTERPRTLREWARHEILQGDKEIGAKMWWESRELFVKLGAQLEADKMNELPE